MDEQRLERALRHGPPFATGYVPSSLALDEQAVVRPPVTVGRLVLIVAVTALLLVGMIAGLAALGALPTPPEEPSVDLGIFEPVAGRIVYWAGGSSFRAVDASAPADPVRRVQLTPEAGTPLGWSRDGTQLLIMRGSLDEGRLFVVHADGSETQVTEQPMSIRGATISPDGSRVVFAGGSGTSSPEGGCCARFALYAVDADGGPAALLVESRIGILDGVSFSPDGTRIAYADGAGDNNHHVWLMKADGSDAHEIVAKDCACHVYGLAWSPAGDRIALGLEGNIYTFAPDGSGFRRVITQGDRPYWSPDGSQIAYTISCLHNINGCGLAIADAGGSNVRTFSSGASGPWHPGRPETEAPSPTEDPSAFGIFEPVAGRIVYGDGKGGISGVDPDAPADPATRVQLSSEAGIPLGWSRDGTRLLVARGSPNDARLLVLHADGSEALLPGPAGASPRAAISPDGRFVFWNGLYAVDATGGRAEMLIEHPGAWAVAFSPDGTRIAYVAGPGDHSNSVWLMDADGSDAHEIVSNESNKWPGHVRGLAWSGSDRIALGLGGSIYTFAPDGSGFTRVTNDGVFPYWSPDGSRVAYSVGFQSNFTTGILAIADADGSNVRTFGFGISGPWHPGTNP